MSVSALRSRGDALLRWLGGKEGRDWVARLGGALILQGVERIPCSGPAERQSFYRRVPMSNLLDEHSLCILEGDVRRFCKDVDTALRLPFFKFPPWDALRLHHLLGVPHFIADEGGDLVVRNDGAGDYVVLRSFLRLEELS